MVELNKQISPRRTNDKHERSFSYPLDNFPARISKQNPAPPVDEVILSLANAYENKCARQINEWEQLRRHIVRRSFA